MKRHRTASSSSSQMASSSSQMASSSSRVKRRKIASSSSSQELMASSSRVKGRKTSSSSSSQELMASSSRMRSRKTTSSSRMKSRKTTSSSSSEELELNTSSDEDEWKKIWVDKDEQMVGKVEWAEWKKISDQKDKLQKHVRGMAIDAFNKVKKHANSNAATEYESLRLLLLSQRKIQEKIKAKTDDFDRLYHEDPDLWHYRMISDDEELEFKEELYFCENEVKFTDDLIKCDKLKYDSPPATIAEVARELFDKYPLETKHLARNLVKERVRWLRKRFDAERKFDLQKLILSQKSISNESDTCHDLKSLKKSLKKLEGFHDFDESEIHDEITDYKQFLWGYEEQDEAREDYWKYIVETYDTIIKQFERPYGDGNSGNGNSTLNLAKQVVHGEYIIRDMKKEIVKLMGH